MAVAFRSSATYNSGGSTTSSIVVNVPAGAQAGDLMVVSISCTGGTGVTITPPAGFGTTATLNVTTVWGTYVYNKVMSSGDTSYTFSLSVAGYAAATISAFTGARTSGAGASFITANMGNVSKTTSGTTTSNVTGMIVQPDPGYVLDVVGSYNTTASVTATSTGTGFTTLADATTTGTNFLESAVGGLANASTGLRSYTGQSGTFSGTVTNANIMYISIRQDMTQLTAPAIDFGNRNGVNAASSASLSFFPSIMFERAIVIAYIQGATGTVSSITTSGLTWTLLSSKQDAGNTMRVEVWTAILGQTIQSYAAAITFSGSVVANYVGISYVNTGPISNVLTATAATGVATSVLTTATPNAIVLGALVYADNPTVTPNNGNAAQVSALYSAGNGTTVLLRQTAGSSGSSITSSVSAPTTSPWAMIQFEVPAATNTGNFLEF